MKFNEVKTTKN